MSSFDKIRSRISGAWAIDIEEDDMRLLSVDWDYFFPDPIGGPMFYAGRPVADPKEMAFRVWLFRSKLYIERSATLPVTSGDENHFWERFCFAPDCRLFVAQCHRDCAHPAIIQGVSELWNFDAHHDAGYEDLPRGSFSDENWMMAYPSQVPKYVRYPRWKHNAFDIEPPTHIPVDRAIDDGAAIEAPFDVVFLCRTDNLVPPWLDSNFERFAESCPVKGPRSRRPLTVRREIVDRLKGEDDLHPLMREF